MDADLLAPILGQAVSQLPIYGVWIVGLYLINERAAGHPESARLLTGGLAVCLVTSLGTLPLIVMPMWLTRTRGYSMAEAGAVMSAVGILRTLIYCVGWGLVLAGALSALRAAGERRG